MVHVPPIRRLLYGAVVGAALPFVLNGGIGAFVSAKVATFAQAFFAGLAAPLTVGGSLDFTTSIIWSAVGASFGLALGNFFDSDAKHRCSYGVVMTAVIAALCVGAAINFQSALTTFFVVMTFGYALVQQLDSAGVFSFAPTLPTATFDDLPATNEIWRQVYDLAMGERENKAVRLVLAGPPGTGKTSIANAIAHACHKRVITVRSSDLHAADPVDTKIRIYNLFRKAISSHSLILFEEFEGVSRMRSHASEQRSDEITALMGQLEDLDQIPLNLFIIATTNYPDSIDPAVVRPGRFDRTIEVGLPNEQQRAEIISYYRVKLNVKQDSKWINPEHMEGWSAADIAAFVRTAASNPQSVESRYHEIQRNIQRAKASHAPSIEERGDAPIEASGQRQKIKELTKQLIHLIGLSPTDLASTTVAEASS